MEENKTAAPNAAEPAAPRPKKVRRVGTVAFALLLIAAGILLLVQQFVPDFDLLAIVRFAPVLLIVLGAEVLYYSAKPDVEVKFGWLSVLGCAFTLVVVGCAALIPLVWDYAGPARDQARTRYNGELQNAAYEALTDDPDLKARVNMLYANVWFNHTEQGGYTLQSGDTVELAVELLPNTYADAETFAADCYAITQALQEAGLPVTDYQFNSQTGPSDSGVHYSLHYLASFAEGLTADQLAGRVACTWQYEGNVYDTQAERDNAVKAILREEVIAAFQDANNGEYPGEDTIRQEVEQRFAELYPQPAAQDAEPLPAATPETAA